MTDTDFAKLMATLAALYPRFTLTSITIKAYRAILTDLPDDLLKAATLHCGATSTFFPAAAELRKAAFDLIDQNRDVPDAYSAFAEVMASFHTCNPTEWSHPLIAKAIEAVGGLHAIGFTDESELGVLRAHFTRAYETLARRERNDQALLPAVQEAVARLTAGYKMLGNGNPREGQSIWREEQQALEAARPDILKGDRT